VVRTAAIRCAGGAFTGANLGGGSHVAQTQTRPLEEFLSDYVYAQPRFILLVLLACCRCGAVLWRSECTA